MLRIDRLQAFVIEPEALQRAGLEILQNDVGSRGDGAHDLLPFGLVEIERDRALAAVDRKVVAGLAGRLAGFVLEKRRPPRARVVAHAGALDLDDVGAEIGQNLTGPRPCHDPAQIEHADVRQRTGHFSPPISASCRCGPCRRGTALRRRTPGNRSGRPPTAGRWRPAHSMACRAGPTSRHRRSR